MPPIHPPELDLGMLGACRTPSGGGGTYTGNRGGSLDQCRDRCYAAMRDSGTGGPGCYAFEYNPDIQGCEIHSAGIAYANCGNTNTECYIANQVPVS